MQNVTTTTVASTETTTENPSPSSSGYSLTYTHSTENGTVVVANNDSDSGIAKSRKKGDLDEPIEELPSLPDPPYHAEAENATTRELSSTSSRSPAYNLIAGNNINYLLKVLGTS